MYGGYTMKVEQRYSPIAMKIHFLHAVTLVLLFNCLLIVSQDAFALTKPTLTSPSDNANITTASQTFSWSHPYNDQYELKIKTSGGTLKYASGKTSSKSKTVDLSSIPLTYGSTYKWYVVVYANGQEDSSADRWFTFNFAGRVDVSGGVSVSPPNVTVGQNFDVSFKLREFQGGNKAFEYVELWIQDSGGSDLYMAQRWSNVTFSANQELPFVATTYLDPTQGRGAGTYRAIVRGKVAGDTPFNFGVVSGSGAVNPQSFNASVANGVHPVILVHGWGGHAGPETWGEMASLLIRENAQRPVYYFDNWNYNDGQCSVSGSQAQDKSIDIMHLAACLAKKVQQVQRANGGIPVDIVAHSMGGLVARAWIAGMARDNNGNHVPYGGANGEIRKLITAATPHYGAGGEAWCILDYFLGFDLFGCHEIQAKQMTYGNQFLWDLHQNWESAANKPNSSDILTIVATSDGTVTDPASATFPNTDIRARYVYKDHISFVGSQFLTCGGSDGVVCIDDATHSTFKLVNAFLQDPASDPCDPNDDCWRTPHRQKDPYNQGSLFMRFVEKNDPTKRVPVPVDWRVSRSVVTHDPTVIFDVEFFYGGGEAGTLVVTDLPAGQYQLTIHGREFYPDSPKYLDEFRDAPISSGRVTVLSQQELTRTEDNYTVILATAKTGYVAGQETFSLFAQLCCTIPTVQSNGVQNSITAAAAQSTQMDGYIWVEIPGGGRFFLMPDFTNLTDIVTPVVSSLPIGNFAGSILRMPIPDSLPVGTYNFFAVGVIPGSDPFNAANWVTNRAEYTVTLTK
ncbi:MAG: hypothetical protein C3F08_03580 [Candidatus Methylomirabilota bacterium]|nr:MAG: hypothetical protein C3F08_03580 [candidate division NC10 bacterium]